MACGGAGRLKVEKISIQKLAHPASLPPFVYSVKGKHITDGTVTTRKPGKARGDVLLFKQTHGIVLSLRVAVAKDAWQPAESITLSFGKFEFNYRPTNPDGSLGTEKSSKWDVAAGKSV